MESLFNRAFLIDIHLILQSIIKIVDYHFLLKNYYSAFSHLFMINYSEIIY